MRRNPTPGSDHVRRVQELFHEAIAIDEDGRRNFIVGAANGDKQLIEEVLQLLAHHDPDDQFLDPICPNCKDANMPDTIHSGSIVGAYRLTRLIETGGMGTVWVGERADGLFEQRVAVKLLSWGLVSAQRRRRFDTERRTLAQLEHPYISRLIDGGTTNDGVAYLVMEYVEGTPIDAYCLDRQVTLKDRLELFRKVCDGVQHAHHHLIIHCDLTPSNILVTSQACPKLVDFGLSRLHADVTEAGSGEFEDTPARAFTPQYASPEQVRGDCLTTATDVYSLGVVLSRLLASPTHTPAKSRAGGECKTKRLARAGETNNTLASRGKLQEEMEAGTSSPHRSNRCAELDSIIHRATQKDPWNRYPSVEQFSEDIRRYVGGVPVLAHPSTVQYRVGKYVRRHAIASGLATALALALIVGSVGMTVGFLRANENARAAVQAEAEATASAAFLTDMLVSADPLDRRYKGPNYSVRELLDDASLRLPTALAEFPSVQLTLKATLGKTYRSLGMYEEGEKYLRGVLAARRSCNPPVPIQLSMAQRELADLLIDASRLDEADELLHNALARLSRHDPFHQHERANTLESRGRLACARGRFEESAAVLQDAYEIRRVHSPERDLAGTLHQLGSVLVQKADYANAVVILRQALVLRRRLLGTHHPLTGESMGMLGYALGETHRVGEALRLLKESVTIQRKQLGTAHPGLAEALNLLALFHSRHGELDQADALFREMLTIDRRMLPPEHPDIAAALTNLSQNLRKLGQHDEAAQHAKEAIEILLKNHGKQHPTVATAMANLGSIYWKIDRFIEAHGWLHDAYEIRKSLFGESHPHTLESLVELSALRCDFGRFSQAEKMARRGLAISLKDYPKAVKRLVRFEAALGKSLIGQGRLEEAEASLKSAHARAIQTLGHQHCVTHHTVRGLAQLYEAWGKPQRAAPYQRTLRMAGAK